MEHVSRSSSARSSVSGGDQYARNAVLVTPSPFLSCSKGGAKKGPLTAEQLLDLDDDAFAQALDSSYTGSKRNSIDIFSSALSTSARTGGEPSRVQFSNGPNLGASFPPSTANMGMSLGSNPFEPNMAMLNGSQQAAPNPFDNLYQGAPHTGIIPQQDASSNGLAQQSAVHPIAIPGARYADLAPGAKPVMPGNMAPQFANKPADQASVEPTLTITNVPDQKNEPRTPVISQEAPSGPDRDPFADLF